MTVKNVCIKKSVGGNKMNKRRRKELESLRYDDDEIDSGFAEAEQEYDNREDIM